MIFVIFHDCIDLISHPFWIWFVLPSSSQYKLLNVLLDIVIKTSHQLECVVSVCSIQSNSKSFDKWSSKSLKGICNLCFLKVHLLSILKYDLCTIILWHKFNNFFLHGMCKWKNKILYWWSNEDKHKFCILSLTHLDCTCQKVVGFVFLMVCLKFCFVLCFDCLPSVSINWFASLYYFLHLCCHLKGS